jgi:hypothetical protein
VSAIVEKRQARPSFLEGASAQVVADSVIQSSETRRWIDIGMCPGDGMGWDGNGNGMGWDGLYAQA